MLVYLPAVLFKKLNVFISNKLVEGIAFYLVESVLNSYFVCQHVTNGTADARVGCVQRGHLRRVRASGGPRLVPRLPLLRRRGRRRDALRVQAALPGAGFDEHCTQTHSQEVLLVVLR